MQEEKYGRIVVGGNHKDIIYEIKENGCHEVVSHAPTTGGYPCIKINRTLVNIHRWLYQNINKVDLNDLDVRHKCDNPKCINLNHLEHGTRQDNVDDMLERNRQYSVLTVRDVIKIVELYDTNNFTYVKLAEKFNVSNSTISSIFKGETWSHITGIKNGDYPLLFQKQEVQSGEKYINWDRFNDKWRIVIYQNGKRYDLGRELNLQKAIEIRDKFLLENNIYPCSIKEVQQPSKLYSVDSTSTRDAMQE